MKSETAYAALVVSGQEVGERIKCNYMRNEEKVLLTRALAFPALERAGLAEAVRFYASPTAPDWDFVVALHMPVVPTDTINIVRF